MKRFNLEFLRKIRKGDWLVLLTVVAAVVLAFGIRLCFVGGRAKTVIVQVNGITAYQVPLSSDQTIELSGNSVVIENKTVSVTSADCKNQICVHHAPISKAGECIICLPNRVIVTIR